MIDPRFPIGPFRFDERRDAPARAERIAAIRALPGELRDALAGIDEAGLDTPYRDGGWTVRQVCHHLADSHVHAYLRCKWAVTAPAAPAILAYDEGVWAGLPDARTLPVEPSLRLLEGLHERWAAFLEGLDDAAWGRAYLHPETAKEVAVERVAAVYAWHGRHHVAHVRGARGRAAAGGHDAP